MTRQDSEAPPQAEEGEARARPHATRSHHSGLRRYSPAFTTSMPLCVRDSKKFVLVVALITILFCVSFIGLLVNELMELVEQAEQLDQAHQRFKRNRASIDENMAQGDTQEDLPADDPLEEFRRTIVISRVMYTILVCELVVLLISSLGLLKGVLQKTSVLVMAWILIVTMTILYGTAVITRDIHLDITRQNAFHSSSISTSSNTKLVLYSLFVIVEIGFLRFAVRQYQRIKRGEPEVERSGDPRFPGQTIYSISGSTEPQSPENLFKLPSYEEVTAEASARKAKEDEEGSGEGPSDQPPPYEPPSYMP